MQDKVSIKGHVKVTVTDSDGNVKQKVEGDNTVTKVAKNALFAELLSFNAPRNLMMNVKGTAVNFPIVAHVSPGTFGIYCLGNEINVTEDTKIVPSAIYATHVGIGSDVVWYNHGTTPILTEDAVTIIPSTTDTGSYDQANHRLITHYVKTTGSGTINSILWQGSHAYNSALYTITSRYPSGVDPLWKSPGSFMARYALEHTADDTTIWCDSANVDETERYMNGFSLKNKTVQKSISTITRNTFMNSFRRGLIWGDKAFQIVRGTVQTTHIPVTLNIYNEWKNGGTATAPTATSLTINFLPPEGKTTTTTTFPVMLINLETEKLEIYQTTYMGETDAENWGFYVQRAEVDLATPEVVTPVPRTMPFAIGNLNATLLLGYKSPEKYYLPYTHEYLPATNNSAAVAIAAYHPGLITDADWESDDYDFYVAKNVNTADINLEWGMNENGLCQFQPWSANGGILIGDMGRVMAGLNLPESVTKGENDILHIEYSFGLGS
jgi:hypothetical protein